jgi:FtsP/CotA-like multicopper oxidase with cupredoxin domain
MPTRLALLALVALLAACAAPPAADGARPSAGANDNRVPAGAGAETRVVSIVARPARWAPDADSLGVLEVEAFGEEGKAPSVPGPLLRVPTGTAIRLAVRNALPDTLVVCGLAGRWCAGADTLRVAPGATAAAELRAGAPGTYVYWGGVVRDGRVRSRGVGGQLVGAYVVDSAGAVPNDRVLVMTSWGGARPVQVGSDTPFVMAINGRTWPRTERLAYAVGDTVRWRVISMGGPDHPMHLHGAYFRVDAKGDRTRDTVFAPDRRPWVVTENMVPLSTMAVTWVPPRAGRWLFHCHRAAHMSAVQRLHLRGLPTPRLRDVPADGHDHAATGMAGLVMGIDVAGPAPPPARAPGRRLRLLVQRRAGHYGSDPGFGYVLHEGGAAPAADSVRIPGPTLVLTRDEPVEVTIVNRADRGTAVHWHGIELESYFDGVPGFSGPVNGGTASTTPMIAPGDSFVARFTPPRAGTFIYHTHANEQYQLSSGLYGALVVLDDRRDWDPSTDHVMLLGQDGPSDSGLVVLNGAARPRPAALRAGVTHRFRFINMTPQDMAGVGLRNPDSSLATWTPVAKDGADLPRALRAPSPARVTLGPGETYDFAVAPRPGLLRLEVESFNAVTALLRFR